AHGHLVPARAPPGVRLVGEGPGRLQRRAPPRAPGRGAPVRGQGDAGVRGRMREWDGLTDHRKRVRQWFRNLQTPGRKQSILGETIYPVTLRRWTRLATPPSVAGGARSGNQSRTCSRPRLAKPAKLTAGSGGG